MPENETDSAWVYQPFESGARDGTAISVGAVSSYRRVKTTFVTLPARSRQRPGIDALELSTEDDLVDAIRRFADMRKRRSRLATGGVLPKHLELMQ